MANNTLTRESVSWVKCESHSIMSDSLWPYGLYSPWNSPGQNTGMGSLSLLQGIFPTQGSNPGLPHFGQILYQLSHKGSPRILEWDSLSLLQWIFPTQESNQGLLHCRRILSYQGSPIELQIKGKQQTRKNDWRKICQRLMLLLFGGTQSTRHKNTLRSQNIHKQTTHSRPQTRKYSLSSPQQNAKPHP